MSLAMRETAPATETSRWDYVLGTWKNLDVPDGWRAEIVDDNGVMLVAPPSDPHNFIAVRMTRALNRVMPDDWDVYQTLGIQLPSVERLYVPDLVVMPESVVPCTHAVSGGRSRARGGDRVQEQSGHRP